MNETEQHVLMPWWAYAVANLLVWIYTVAFVLLSRNLLKDSIGVGFLSLSLPIGFALVSIFDYFYDRLRTKRD